MSEELPKGWERVTLGQLGSLHCGQSPSASAVNRLGIGTPYVSGPEQWDGKAVHLDKWTTEPTRVVGTETIFITVKGAGVGTTFPGVAASIGRDIYAFEPAPEINRRYVHLAIDHTIAEILRGVRGDIPGLAKPDIIDHEIGLSPTAEQQRIVAKIDSLFARSSRARDELARIPRLIERYRQAVLEAAFRGDLTADWRDQNPGHEPMANRLAHVRAARLQAKLGNRRRDALANLPKPPPDLPPLPHGWEWICVEELASDTPRSIQSGPFGSNLKHSEFTNDGMLVIGIDNAQDGYFSMGSQNRISPGKFQELIKYKAYPGDVLITVMATVGRCCVVPDDIEPSIITKHVYRITCEREIILPLFLMNALRGSADVLRQMGAEIRGQTRPGINGSILKGLFIPLPPVTEQMLILKRVQEAFACTQRGSEEASRASDLLTRLDASILDKAFSGTLVPQNPDDEPASVLLERIRAARAEAPKPKRGRRAKG